MEAVEYFKGNYQIGLYVSFNPANIENYGLNNNRYLIMSDKKRVNIRVKRRKETYKMYWEVFLNT